MSYKRITYKDGQVVSEEILLSIEEYRQLKLQDLSAACSAAIDQAVPPYQQRSAALGVYDAAKTTQIQETVATHIAQHNKLRALILQANTYDELSTINWVI